MKLNKLFLILVGLFTAMGWLSSCADDAIELDTNKKGEGLFRLSVSTGKDTRVSLGADNYTLYWDEGDQLTLQSVSSMSDKFVLSVSSIDPSDRTQASFISDTPVHAGDYYVLYKNDNDARTYKNQPLRHIDQINSNYKPKMYSILHVDNGQTNAAVEMKNIYAKVRISINDDTHLLSDDASLNIGICSTYQGFPDAVQLVNNYGTAVFNEGRTIPTIFGENGVRYYYNSNLFIKNRSRSCKLVLGTNISLSSSLSEYDAFILPVDLSEENYYFYIFDSNNTSKVYEFKRDGCSIGTKLIAGGSYRMDFNMSDANIIEVPKLAGIAQISSAAHLRAARYLEQSISFYEYENLTPIDIVSDFDCNDESDSTVFPLGIFNIRGNNHVIHNLSMDYNKNMVGLLEYKGIVSDLTLSDVKINGLDYVGAFCGLNAYIKNCALASTDDSHYSSVSGNNYVGGLVGVNEELPDEYWTPSIINSTCDQHSRVNGSQYVGGMSGAYLLVDGYSNMVEFDNLVNNATVTSTDSYVGGIVGYVTGTGIDYEDGVYFGKEFIKNCTNKGQVSGEYCSGGIVGGLLDNFHGYMHGNSHAVFQCSNEGDIYGSNNVGGIVGSSMAPINASFNIGNIAATNENAGGIVGKCDFVLDYEMSFNLCKINNCFSLGNVTSSNAVGGILGFGVWASVSNCYSSGKLTGSYVSSTSPSGFAGGIVGAVHGTNINNCLTSFPTIYGGVPDGMETPDVNNCFSSLDGYNGSTIQSMISIINNDNVYSATDVWDTMVYPAFCPKFASNLNVGGGIGGFDPIEGGM